MRYKFSVIVLMTVLLMSSLQFTIAQQTDTIEESTQNEVRQSPIDLSLDQMSEPMGVVIIDDIHNNDYASNDEVTIAIDKLEEQGYIADYASEYSSWDEAVNSANYLVMSAPYTSLTSSEINSVKSWFESTSGNLLLSSRGDFQDQSGDPLPKYDTMNTLLDELSSSIHIQDDNVYTTDPEAYRSWYIETDNFDTTNYNDLFTGVGVVNLFSPSSIDYGASADVIIHAEAQAYQTDQSGDPPNTIFDDTDDGVGGDSIPVGVYENMTLGDATDRVIAVGSTLWSDFDYGDSYADDTAFFDNILAYFRSETLTTLGEIPLNVEDKQAPSVEITFPHDLAYLSGSVELQISASDAFGVTEYQISIAGEVVSTSNSFVWDTTQYQDGIYTVSVTVSDEAGNSASTSNTYFVYQAYEPYRESDPKFMTYNIKESGAFEGWFDVMIEENADVAVLVETGDFDDNSNQLLDQYVSDLNEIFFDEIQYEAYTLQDIANGYNGITILSRYDITSNMKLATLTDDTGNNVNIPLPFLHSVLDINGNEVNVIGAHLTCCPGQANWDQREEQQESILNYMDTLGDEPIVYLGDMNAISPYDVDPASQEVENDLGTEPIEMVVNASHPKSSTIHTFVDTAYELGTIDNTYIGSILSRIDYVFVNQHLDDLLLSSTTGDTDSALIGSDHVSVDVNIDLTGYLTEPIFNLTTITAIQDTDTSSQTNVGIGNNLSFTLLLIAIIPLIKLRNFKNKHN